MDKTMTDHALKAARDVAKVLLTHDHGDSRSVEQIISQAIQEATGPYRELVEKWRREANSYQRDNLFGPNPQPYEVVNAAEIVVRLCASELEALLPKETK